MDQKEIRDAVLAGEAALDSLRSAREKLESAKNWGVFDMLGGGNGQQLHKAFPHG